MFCITSGTFSTGADLGPLRIEHNKLEFTLTLKVRRDKHLQPRVQQPAPRPQQITPPPRPTPPPQKEKSSGLRFWSSSPKKGKPAKSFSTPSPTPRATPSPPPPQPVVHEDPLVRFLKPDGTLGRTFVSFKDMAPFCDTTLYETTLDLVSSVEERLPNGRSGSRKIGDMVVQMFRLPPLPGVPADQLPQSLEECLRGMRHVNWHKIVYHEGILTQNGGDCKVRLRLLFTPRRLLELIANCLHSHGADANSASLAPNLSRLTM